MKQKITMVVGTLVICMIMGISMAAGALICLACRHEPLMIFIGGLMFTAALVGFVVYLENDDDKLAEEDTP